ncbi:MAG: leucyl aminopeptidase [bacterium]|nr:leucyl aminopeptidase [bacterium]
MRWTISKTPSADTAADLLVFPTFQVKDKADIKDVLLGTKGGVRKAAPGETAPAGIKKKVASSGFVAKACSLLPVYCSNTKAGWLVLAGLGDETKLDLETIRKTAGTVAKKAREMKAKKVLVVVPDSKRLGIDDVAFSRAWVEGAEMSLSPTGAMKTAKKSPEFPASCVLLADISRAKDLRAGAAEAQKFVAGCFFARALVNEPPNIQTPVHLAESAKKMAKEENLKCKILTVPQMKKLNMGGLLGVGQGSANPPRLISLEYRGGKSKKSPTIALVGKGVTFDTGGISLKPGASMDLMKSDMGGAAAVLGATKIIAQLGLDVNLITIIPTAENMPDGNAIRPADVLTMANGKTVEVLNTDAEGRLILADALWYAGRSKPDYIMDAATLTGACVVALGTHFAGLMSNSSELIDSLKQAGGETFERVWHLPLIDEHKDAMKGTWGDLKNLGPREGGAMTAAGFLAHFVPEETQWAHIDIAGPSYAERPATLTPVGGTGFGARLMARAVQIIAS